MVAVPFDITHLRPAAAIVAAHGVTDLDSWRWPPWYALCCFAPMSSELITGLFVLSSVVHFSEDIGANGSVVLHCLAGLAIVAGGTQGGLEFMTAYLACIHTPAHYVRCWQRERWKALALSLVVTALALVLTQHVQVVCVSDAAQRLVMAHILCEWNVVSDDTL